MVAVEEMIEQLSTLIKECEESLSSFHPYWWEDLLFLRYRLHAAIYRCTIPGDSYRKNLDDVVFTAVTVRDSPDIASAETLPFIAIAEALRADLRDGGFRSVSELIHADMFSDLLEIARELYEKRHKDAAAVQAGTALELHLRLLAEKHNIEIVRSTFSKSAATHVWR